MQEVHGKRNFDFMPDSLVLPKQWDELRIAMERDSFQWWILKPCSSSQGKGIIITNKFSDLAHKKGMNLVASHYVSNPLLIDGLKFDLRIYVAVTSINPLRIYMYDEGLTRFATTKYEPPDDNVNNKQGKFTHLTNYAINKNNKEGYVKTSGLDDFKGSKWSLTGLRKVLRANEIDDVLVFGKIKDIVIKTFISVENEMKREFFQQVPFRNNCFQLFGFDIMIDDKLNAWLLEVNQNPSLSYDTQLDLTIKGSLISDLLNLIGIVSFEHQKQYLQPNGGEAIDKAMF